MKKVLCLLLASVLIFAFTACGGSQDSGSSDTADEGTAEVIATLMINTEGLGSIAYGLEGEDVEFDEEYPSQSAMVNLEEPATYVIKAKPDEEWKFVKWTKNGEDFSEESEITVEVAEDVEYVAVFDVE